MKAVLLNGTTVFVYSDAKWTTEQVNNWIKKGMDKNPNNLDKFLASKYIHRVTMSNFNYRPHLK